MGEKEIQAINKFFDLLRPETLLHYPDFNKSFELSTDAADTGKSGILLQEQKLVGIYN